ncbi:MAG TPA: hypothetical protein VMF52_05130 [Steroidobacteraceae bacterium]|nr:hypothetical protein [Steroidobacteraceae bacterium]
MSVAHDLNVIDEQKRKESAQTLVAETSRQLRELRLGTAALESGDDAQWREARVFALELIQAATPLELSLLIACAKEVLHFSERRFAFNTNPQTITLYMLSALETLALELERLKRDPNAR